MFLSFLLIIFFCLDVNSLRNGFNPRQTNSPLFQVLEYVSHPQLYKSSSPQVLEDAVSITNSRNVWLDIFQSPLSSIPNDTQRNSFIARTPDLGAWKTIVDTNIETPPCSLAEYLDGTCVIDGLHGERVTKLWRLVRNRGSIRHLDDATNDKLMDALCICYVALWGRKTTRSFEDSSSRARGIASVLGELDAPVEVVLAGILHEVTALLIDSREFLLIEELTKRFGSGVIKLALSYSQLPKFMAKRADYTPEQAQAQLEMLVSQAEEYRCLYIRLADRIHTMRELKKLPLDDQEKKKIAEEALHVYAPLAHKMNVIRFKGELEDLSLSVLRPDIFELCRYTQTAANKAFHEAHDKIKQIVAHDPIFQNCHVHAKIDHRIKDKYQLFWKMQRKGLSSPMQVRDALGLRIILESKVEGDTDESRRVRNSHLCYHLVEKLRSMPEWGPVSDGFKDYIANPKPNGYQSLHQYIKKNGFETNVEVQVRTLEMHRNAEIGEAAHWHYKDQIFRPEIASSKSYRQVWRSPAQLKAQSAAEVIGLAKKYLRDHRVFVFSEDKSTVLNLKKGSTALDAAFSIHTDVGLNTQTVFVDGNPVPFDHVLRAGAVVSVNTGGSVPLHTKLSWLGFTKTRHAQMSIRRYLRNEYPDAVLCMGIVQLLSVLMFNDAYVKQRLDGRVLDISFLQKSVKQAGFTNLADFFKLLGVTHSTAELTKVIGRVFDLKPGQLKASEIQYALMWARMQGNTWGQGWEDLDAKHHLLLPLLESVLPTLGFPNVKTQWCDLIGEGSLVAPREPSAELTEVTQIIEEAEAISRLQKGRGGMNINRQPMQRRPNMHALKPILQPYSLEAAALPPKWQAIAKRNYAARVERNNQALLASSMSSV